MNGNHLIDRYIHAVGKHLPEKNRSDVQLELRTALQDMLEERGLKETAAEDQTQMAEMLKEFGKPLDVAARYHRPPRLIGQELLPVYWLVVRINLIAIAVLHIFGLAIGAVDQSDPISLFAGAFSGFVDNFATSFGIVTAIFILLDRAGVGSEIKEKDWNPFDLPEVTPDRERAKLADLIVESFFLAAMIVFVNWLPGWAASVGPLPGDWAALPALANEFAPFLPLLSAVWGVELALNVFVLVRVRWSAATRWVQFALSVAGVGAIAYTLTAAPFTEVAVVDLFAKISISITLLFASIEAAMQLYRLVFPGKQLPWRTGDVRVRK